MQQLISSHESILNTLSEKATSMGEPAMKKRFDEAMKKYSDLNDTNKKNTKLTEKYVVEHEQLNNLLEKAADLILHLNIELSVLADTPFDAKYTAKRIDTVNGLLKRKNEGNQMHTHCEKVLVTGFSHNTKEGVSELHTEVKDLNKKWNDFIKDAESFKE